MTLAGVTSSNRTDPDLLIDPNSGDIERETQISTAGAVGGFRESETAFFPMLE